MITTTKFPLLKWLNYRRGNQPTPVPEQAIDQEGQNFIKASKSFQTLIGLIEIDYCQGRTLEERIVSNKPLAAGQPPYSQHRYLSKKVAR